MLKITEYPKNLHKVQYGTDILNYAVINEPFEINTQLENTDFRGVKTKGVLQGNADDIIVILKTGEMTVVNKEEFGKFYKEVKLKPQEVTLKKVTLANLRVMCDEKDIKYEKKRHKKNVN